MDSIKVDKTLDVKGVGSERIGALAKTALGSMCAGQVLKIVTDDPSTRSVISDICSDKGHLLIESQEDKGMLLYAIKKVETEF